MSVIQGTVASTSSIIAATNTPQQAPKGDAASSGHNIAAQLATSGTAATVSLSSSSQRTASTGSDRHVDAGFEKEEAKSKQEQDKESRPGSKLSVVA